MPEQGDNTSQQTTFKILKEHYPLWLTHEDIRIAYKTEKETIGKTPLTRNLQRLVNANDIEFKCIKGTGKKHYYRYIKKVKK